jgi:hypothetical protein
MMECIVESGGLCGRDKLEFGNARAIYSKPLAYISVLLEVIITLCTFSGIL